MLVEVTSINDNVVQTIEHKWGYGHPDSYSSFEFRNDFNRYVERGIFVPLHIVKGHTLPGAPALSSAQQEAIELVKAISEELHFGMQLEPGDIQLLNNLVVFHSRTEYEDWPEPDRKRLLWRLWLNSEDVRPSTPFIARWQAGVKPSSAAARIVLGM